MTGQSCWNNSFNCTAKDNFSLQTNSRCKQKSVNGVMIVSFSKKHPDTSNLLGRVNSLLFSAFPFVSDPISCLETLLYTKNGGKLAKSFQGSLLLGYRVDHNQKDSHFQYFPEVFLLWLFLRQKFTHQLHNVFPCPVWKPPITFLHLHHPINLFLWVFFL